MTSRAIDSLARFLVETVRADLPEHVFARSADCVLDALAAAAIGRQARSTIALRSAFERSGRVGEATLWFERVGFDPVTAATINCMTATAADIDDGHRVAAGHPGAAVVSAACATAQTANSTFEEFLVAVVLGYETAVRVALARKPEHHTSTVSGRWAGAGAAAAGARLQRVDIETMAQAVLIAEQHAPRLSSAQHHGYAGSDVKEGLAWTTHTALHAVELAKAGFRGYPDTFDQGILYDPATLVGDLDGFAALDGLFHKPYACCRWIHGAIDGLRSAMAEASTTADEVDRVDVLTFIRAVELGNHVAPRSEAEAQFSIPFCLAAIAVGGDDALTPLDPALMSDPHVIAFAKKVHYQVDAEMEDLFPAKAPAIVEVAAGGRTVRCRIEAPFGDPGNPMRRADIQAKFRKLAGASLPSNQVERIIERFAILDDAAETPAREAMAVASS